MPSFVFSSIRSPFPSFLFFHLYFSSFRREAFGLYMGCYATAHFRASFLCRLEVLFSTAYCFFFKFFWLRTSSTIQMDAVRENVCRLEQATFFSYFLPFLNMMCLWWCFFLPVLGSLLKGHTSLQLFFLFSLLAN